MNDKPAIPAARASLERTAANTSVAADAAATTAASGVLDATTTTTAGAPSGKRSGFRSLVGYSTLAWREGHAEITLTLGAIHLNNAGITHGGVYMTLIDAAMGHAATWCSVRGNTRPCVTVSLTTSFLAPARAGETITAIGTLRGVEGRLATCDGVVVDSAGRRLVIAQASFQYGRGGEKLEGVAKSTGGD